MGLSKGWGIAFVAALGAVLAIAAVLRIEDISLGAAVVGVVLYAAFAALVAFVTISIIERR